MKKYPYVNRGLGWSTGWTAFCDYFDQIMDIGVPEFKDWVEYMQSGIWDAIAFEDDIVILIKPTVVLEEGKEVGQNRLHNLTGPAILWEDGNKAYFVAGVRIDGKYIENPETITKDIILNEQNVEVRKSLIQIIGVDKFLEMVEGVTVDEDVDLAGMPRRLVRFPVGEDHWCVIEVKCPSKGDLHYIWVNPESTTCKQAVASSFSMSEEEYCPVLET